MKERKVFSGNRWGGVKWRCSIKIPQVCVDDFCQSWWGKLAQAPDFTEWLIISKWGSKQKKCVSGVSKLTKESAVCQGYTSPHGALRILQSLPVSSKGVPSWGRAHSSVDSKPHACPQPASLVRAPPEPLLTTALPLVYTDIQDSISAALLPHPCKLPQPSHHHTPAP